VEKSCGVELRRRTVEKNFGEELRRKTTISFFEMSVRHSSSVLHIDSVYYETPATNKA
jgi:hypothetical protein